MKSIFRLLFGKRLRVHPDSYAMTRDALWDSIAKSIRLQHSMGKSVWLVAHFLETFSDCQSMLEQHAVDYRVETESAERSWLESSNGDPDDCVRLLLADRAKPLANREVGVERYDQRRLAIMVVERHPFGPRDEQLMLFADSLPGNIEVGYFLALDDELVRRLIPTQLIDLMKAMGLQERDLVSSAMVTRRLKKLIDRSALEQKDDGETAASAAQWFARRKESRL